MLANRPLPSSTNKLAIARSHVNAIRPWDADKLDMARLSFQHFSKSDTASSSHSLSNVAQVGKVVVKEMMQLSVVSLTDGTSELQAVIGISMYEQYRIRTIGISGDHPLPF